MYRVFLTGDKHGDFSSVFNFIEKFELGFGDWIIILGDAGICWRNDKKDMEEFIKYYESKYEVMLMFVPGNHENWDILDNIPLAPSGVGEISEHILYIPKGTYFELCGKHFLAVGGADSIDKKFRTPHLTWWEQEQINEEDINKAISATDNHKIDYVLTHSCPRSIFEDNKAYLITLGGIDQDEVDHTSEDNLEKLKNSISFDQWRFGHYHADKQLNKHFRCLFNDFEEIT